MAKTLEDFIKSYLSDKSKALGAKGYAKWLSEYSVNPSVKKAQTVAQADTSYRTSLSGYGKNAEGLAASGLSDSGYAEYLNALSKSARDTELARAALTEGKSAARDMKDYQTYLDGIEDERSRLYEKAVKAIESDKLAAYGAAYDRALALGLDEESARRAATEASSAVKSALKQKLLTEISTKRMTSEATRAYALTVGLDEEVADELAEFAHKLNESTDTDGTTESYLNYLKNLLEKG